MKYLVIFLILIGTIGMSSALESKEIKLDEPFMIKLHQRLSIDDLDVEFSEIEDSRCPSDVTCIWEGRASITLHIYNQTQYQTITLTTDETPTFHVSSYKIDLIDILPYPVSTKDISEEYVATINISKNKKEIVLSPLKQFKNGIPSNLIDCKPTLVLIIKNSDGSPACVKPDTKSRLFERGWATVPV
ncbi:MAG: hypothetical protein EPO37_04645 [Nitrosarchaeum sp.]|nr:MAG: hypothetical protein EPO37_04645 [Nitrosarchaeum sp.]